ncbi:protease [Treponema phagedenis]|uniref:Protease n=1 Tax=Treponema phagedenis TaxID=162 RepID=A0AAE6IVZ3_TREPH|nr:hypothetical protein [Treponema phagedenis]EFW38477.1 methyl-accepting chemotaxis protein [Treponema phagedenis F0421]NVP24211.1 protease [Treponema phagedenis]QEJ99231.1 protease [Treponema phagedenis]QEK04797.1 protease [Treponema phagedenis]QEK10417.1 protease [Treponema phagedenis]
MKNDMKRNSSISTTMPKTKNRFPIRRKLLVVFGLLVAGSVFAVGLLALNIAQKAVIEKVETNLIEKAKDTAEIVDCKIDALFQLLESIASIPIFQDDSLTYDMKLEISEGAI